jgi:uncharacterized iron-regulated membrane protein
MSADLSSGLPWVIINIAAVLVLGFAVIYGTMMWNRRRRNRLGSSVMRADGPASKRAEERDRAA